MVEYVAELHSGFSPLFYILIGLIFLIITAIIILIKKLELNRRDFFKLFLRSLKISFFIELGLLILSIFLPGPMCKPGGSCPTNPEILFQTSIFRIVSITIIWVLIKLSYEYYQRWKDEKE